MTSRLRHLSFSFLLTATGAFCQSATPSATAGTPEQPLIDYSLSFDAYSEAKLGADGLSANLLRNFDVESNRFELGAATLSVQLSKGPFGLHFDSGYGELYKTVNAADPWGGANRYFGQAYFTWRPLKTSDLAIDFGKFYTSAGAEVPDAASNLQYSRSFIFALGTPYYHFGIRTTQSLTPALVVGVQLLNGWNDVVNNTGGPMLGLTATYTKKRFNWSETYLAGLEPEFASIDSPIDALPFSARPKRSSQLIDSVLKLTPTTRMNGYVETVYGRQNRLAQGHDSWYGVAGAITVPLAARWSISPRWEYFDDANGATTGVAQKLQEVTATLQYQPPVHGLLARGEFRCDFSDKPFFENSGAASGAHRQATALLALLYTWKGSR